MPTGSGTEWPASSSGTGVPLENDLIGINKNIYLFGSKDGIVRKSTISISGKTPALKIQTGAILYKGDSFRQIKLRGNNLVSIDHISLPTKSNLELEIGNEFEIEDDNTLYLNVKATSSAQISDIQTVNVD